jgi:hypothetical protein
MDDIGAPAKTPAAEHLFQVRTDAPKLKETKAIHFHNMVARGLCLCKRARVDIQTAIAFLLTRVRDPNHDNWKKLLCLIKYLKGTETMALTLSADELNLIKWWIDASFAVHETMRSHTGGTLSLGKGCVTSLSTKQKLNTKSSTEAELVATDDVMPAIIWTNHFLDAQGYQSNDTIVYQDNKSAILLEKNGKASSGKRTKHINIRYFFIKDRYNKQEFDIQYCPADTMVVDYFTEPLQGKLFIAFRDNIMGITPRINSAQECVGE